MFPDYPFLVTMSRRKLGDNVLFDQLNSYHPNIKLTIEVNPSKFLDTKLTNINGTYKFNVYRKNTKLPSPWTSKTPKRYKQNTINGDWSPVGCKAPKDPKMTQKWVFWGVEKSLVHSYVLFKLEYEIASSPLTFYKNCMPGKNLVLELWAKNL